MTPRVSASAAVAFPDLFFAPAAQGRKQAERAGRRLAAQFAKNGTFDELETRLVEPLTNVWLDAIADFNVAEPAWRLYLARDLRSGMRAAGDWADRPMALSFESYLLQSAWGALESAVGHHAPNSAAVVASRLDALLKFWEPLDTLRYIDRDGHAVTLEAIMQRHYGTAIHMWSGHVPGRSITQTLAATAGAMAGASQDECFDRVVRELTAQVEDTRLTNAAHLRDTGLTRRSVMQLEPADIDMLTGGHLPALLRELHIMDEQAGKT